MFLEKQKDCPYNNQSDMNLKKWTMGTDRGLIRSQICRFPDYISTLKKQVVSLKTSVGAGQLRLPVRNRNCMERRCIWQLEELLPYLEEFSFVGEKNQQVYYCIECMSVYRSNKRNVKDLYLDRELALYIAQAKAQYQKLGQNMSLFKHSTIKMEQNGIVTLIYKFKADKGVENRQIILRDMRKNEDENQIRFNPNSIKSGIDNFKQFLNLYSKHTGKVIKILGQWLVLSGKLTAGQLPQFYEQIISNIGQSILSNLSFKNLSGNLKDLYTYSMTSPIHFDSTQNDLCYLNLFFPLLRIWRSVYLVNENDKNFVPVENAVYLKDRQRKRLLVLGGCTVKYVRYEKQDDIRDFYRKELSYSRTCSYFDMNEFNPLLAKKSGKIKLMYPTSLRMKKMPSLPADFCYAAGVIIDDYIYIFGGSININGSDKLLNTAYRLKISGVNWQPIAPLPKARHNHTAIVHEGKVFLVGGNDVTNVNLPTCQDIDIYDPKSNTYQTVKAVLSAYHLKQLYFLSQAAVVCPTPQGQYLLLTGNQRVPSYIFNPKAAQFRESSSQPSVPHVAKAWRNEDITASGPKIQQVYDYQPDCLNGIFYYMWTSLRDKQTRLVFGNQTEWNIAHQVSPMEQ